MCIDILKSRSPVGNMTWGQFQIFAVDATNDLISNYRHAHACKASSKFHTTKWCSST